MKQRAWRTLAILICLTLLAALGGCADTDQSSVVRDYKDTPQVTLSFVTSSSLTDDIWVKDFTSADGTEIKIVEYSSNYYESEGLTYRELVLKRLENNVDIDCYTIQAEDVIEFSRHNYWMDLSSISAVKSLSEDALKQSTYDGKVFSVPLSYTGFGFFWNVDMLTEHGLTVPGNLNEFLHVCETLKQAGITPYLGNKGFALTVPAMAAGFAELYASEDSERLLAELADGSVPVSTYMSEGFDFIEMMVEKGYMDPEYALNTTPRDADVDDFLAGKGAFFCGAIRSFDDSPFEIVMTGIPALESGTVAVVGASSRMSVNPNSPYSNYAIECLDNLITPEWLAMNAAESKALSSGKGEYDLSYLDEACRDFAKLVQTGGQIPNQDFSLPFNTWEVIRDLCREICSGATAAETAQKYDEIQLEQIAAAQK